MTLELHDIAKRVGADVHIHPTSLTLEPGSFNILLGTTLSGKTTLMQLMAGLERPTGGRLVHNGQDVTGVTVQKRNVSMVYQQFINYPNFSVYENIASPLRVAGLPDSEIKSRVERFADLLKLTPMLGRKPAELSGGQQQRTAMARALVKDSDLVLLDEPLANLDFKLREELRDELPKLFADRECIVVYATTEPTEALLFGGHTATLHEGRVTQFGETGRVYRDPADLITAKVFSEPPINTAAIEKRGAQFHMEGSEPWAVPPEFSGSADGKYTLGVRPHRVVPLAGQTGGVSVNGHILITELSGSESVAHFRFGENDWVSLAPGIHPHNVGDTSAFHADVSDAFYFMPDGTRLAPAATQKEA
ncbi:MAG: ABC transporter ATP-binding protein [Pseudomonadota bacterium]